MPKTNPLTKVLFSFIAIALAGIFVLSITGCDRHHYKKFHTHKYSVEKVLVYRVPVVETNKTIASSTSSSNDDWLYYYIIWNQNNTECTYATSRTPVTSGFSSLNWSRGTSLSSVTGSQKPEELQEEQIPDQELSNQAVQEITAESTQIETVDVDAEPGAGYVNQDGNESMTSEAVSETSDTGSSTDSGSTGDSSSSGDSGGDSGGGDGGGGGD